MDDHSLRKYRLARGISVAEMAQRVGVTRQTIHYIESGARMPSVRLLRRLFRASNGVLTAYHFVTWRNKDEK